MNKQKEPQESDKSSGILEVFVGILLILLLGIACFFYQLMTGGRIGGP